MEGPHSYTEMGASPTATTECRTGLLTQASLSTQTTWTTRAVLPTAIRAHTEVLAAARPWVLVARVPGSGGPPWYEGHLPVGAATA